MKIIKSPYNYVGGKNRLIEQILPYFPDKIRYFVDLFGGGFTVGLNALERSNVVIYNEIDKNLVDFYKYIYENDLDETINKIEQIISDNNLSKFSKEEYYIFREKFNTNKEYKTPLHFYILATHSFNYAIEYDSKGNFNMSSGASRSSFNNSIKKKLIICIEEIQNHKISFSSSSFEKLKIEKFNNNDLIYLDPPYLATGRTGYAKHWSIEKEKELLDFIDKLNEKNIKFALSNVLSDKGKTNQLLIDWCKKYNTYHLNFDYSNSNHQISNKDLPTDEVLITNYII
jgi:DNA adenine methylase Dam